MRIRDLQTQTWATTHAGAAALDDNALVKLLAALGDHPAADQQALMTALGAPDPDHKETFWRRITRKAFDRRKQKSIDPSA